jgi:hypothetical protein
MQLEIDIMLKLITEQNVSSEHMESACVWPHPWEHYPFRINGRRKWLRYQDLEIEQKQLIANALNAIV